MAFPEDHSVHPDGVGRPFSADVIIVDEEGRQRPPQEYGLVRARRPGMAEGYLDDPDASASAFLPGGWFQPGDVAAMESDGTLLFGDRADDMMILGTVKIMPHEIEAIASGFPGILECAAFGYRVASHGDIPMLAVVETGAGHVDLSALMSHCRSRLGLRAPRKILVMGSLPRNLGGKLQRRELAGMAFRALGKVSPDRSGQS
jgi:acyl-CoA synthetase (AMP-forming)/AMP-acid ligase II